MRPTSIQSVADIVRGAQHIVVFTGVGMSAESGIPTFRDDDGFWQRFPVEQFACWEGIVRTALRRPRALAEFAFEVIDPIARAEPNANIDGLHQAGMVITEPTALAAGVSNAIVGYARPRG